MHYIKSSREKGEVLGLAITQMNPLQSRCPSLHARLERVWPRAGKEGERSGCDGGVGEGKEKGSGRGWGWGLLLERAPSTKQVMYGRGLDVWDRPKRLRLVLFCCGGRAIFVKVRGREFFQGLRRVGRGRGGERVVSL